MALFHSSLEAMSQVVPSGSIFKRKTWNWLLSGWINWMALRRLSDSVQSWTFLCWIHDNAIRTSEGSEAFCILDCRRVQQSTLLCSPKARHRCHWIFGFFHFRTIWGFCLFLWQTGFLEKPVPCPILLAELPWWWWLSSANVSSSH